MMEEGIEARKLDKIKAYLMINMQTLTDKTPSHIAEMLIIGSNMGIIDAVKNLKRYKNAEPGIIKLMERLLRSEENKCPAAEEFLEGGKPIVKNSTNNSLEFVAHKSRCLGNYIGESRLLNVRSQRIPQEPIKILS